MHSTPRSQPAHDRFSGPPPEVLDEVAAAWERGGVPHHSGLELWFASEPDLGRAWGELRLPSGDVAMRIPASEAVAIACGDAWMTA